MTEYDLDIEDVTASVHLSSKQKSNTLTNILYIVDNCKWRWHEEDIVVIENPKIMNE